MPSRFRALLTGEATYLGSSQDTPDNPLAKLASAHAAIASVMRYDDALFDRAPLLRVISRTGIGVDNIDIAAATRRGIAVCNTPDAPTISTVEHTVLLMLAALRRLTSVRRHVMAGDTVNLFDRLSGLDACGLTLGLVGLGRIGSGVARVANVLGMEVQAYDPYLESARAEERGVRAVDNLDELLGSSDVVSLHLPLSAATQNFMNRERFEQLKPGAVFINAARGGLVDEVALLAALESGHVRAAGLDVTQVEPPSPDHPLLNRDEVVLTPHIATATEQGRVRLWTAAITQAVQVLKGERPLGLVNPEVWERLRT
ncbi:MAG: hypothetical protein JSV66_14885 [Trueperaceae bacterium]|nr:MAG: hypothetical protein JSV66_14885 [Trueperaceae bacterium]